MVQANIIPDIKQELFKIRPLNEQFFGVMHIPKNDTSNINIGQDVLIKQAGASNGADTIMKGKVDLVADEPVKDHFLVKVVFIEPVDYSKHNIKS